MDARGVSCLAMMPARSLSFEQFGVPVGHVDGVEKWHPFFVTGHAKGLLNEWRPLWLKRSSHQSHVRLVRRPSAFAMVTLVTGAHDIFPNRSATLGARDDVVEIELMAR